jgi:hypothetical protein
MKKLITLLLIAAFLLAACGAEVAEPDVGDDGNRPDITDELPFVPTEPAPPDPEAEIIQLEESEPEIEIIPDDSPPAYNGFEYKRYSHGIEITRYIGEELDVIIPSEIDGITVTDIGSRAFEDTGVEFVYIPDSVRHIRWNVFENCKDIIITLRGKTFTYEDRYNLYEVSILNIEPDPDMVAEWEKSGEWDVSELFLVFLLVRMDGNEMTTISLDGTVGVISPERDDWRESNLNLVERVFSDANIPVTAYFNRIPDDIIESARMLEPFSLNMETNHTTVGGGTSVFIAVGSGDSRRFIKIGLCRWGVDRVFSTNVRANEFFENIREWIIEQQGENVLFFERELF